MIVQIAPVPYRLELHGLDALGVLWDWRCPYSLADVHSGNRHKTRTRKIAAWREGGKGGECGLGAALSGEWTA